MGFGGDVSWRWFLTLSPSSSFFSYMKSEANWVELLERSLQRSLTFLLWGVREEGGTTSCTSWDRFAPRFLCCFLASLLTSPDPSNGVSQRDSCWHTQADTPRLQGFSDLFCPDVAEKYHVGLPRCLCNPHRATKGLVSEGQMVLAGPITIACDDNMEKGLPPEGFGNSLAWWTWPKGEALG